MIPIQYALRRRMMRSNTVKWTLEVKPLKDFASVSIDGNNLEAGVYKVDDGTIAHFEANGITALINVNGKQVAAGVIGVAAKYDLEIHSNCTAIGSARGMTGGSGIWEITTQQ